MPQIYLRHPVFTYSACGPFNENNGRFQKFKETWDSRYSYRNELDKACFQHDLAYWDFKDITRRIAADKVLCDKVFNTANLVWDFITKEFWKTFYFVTQKL